MKTTIRNQKLFCLNCGGEQVLPPFPIPIPILTAMMKAFDKMHKNCPKTWKEPECPQNLPVKDKALWWWEHGERGSSSETLWNFFMDRAGMINYPNDPDDFRRCYKLLKAIPEWRSELLEAKDLSGEWSRLIDKWDKLTEMLEEQFRTNKANGMYELMQECIKRPVKS